MSLTTERPGKTSVMNVYKAKRTAIAIQRSVEKNRQNGRDGQEKKPEMGFGQDEEALNEEGGNAENKGTVSRPLIREHFRQPGAAQETTRQ